MLLDGYTEDESSLNADITYLYSRSLDVDHGTATLNLNFAGTEPRAIEPKVVLLGHISDATQVLDSQ
jgi:hypothetical protein